jgi:hypothetical protein
MMIFTSSLHPTTHPPTHPPTHLGVHPHALEDRRDRPGHLLLPARRHRRDVDQVLHALHLPSQLGDLLADHAARPLDPLAEGDRVHARLDVLDALVHDRLRHDDRRRGPVARTPVCVAGAGVFEGNIVGEQRTAAQRKEVGGAALLLLWWGGRLIDGLHHFSPKEWIERTTHNSPRPPSIQPIRPRPNTRSINFTHPTSWPPPG